MLVYQRVTSRHQDSKVEYFVIASPSEKGWESLRQTYQSHPGSIGPQRDVEIPTTTTAWWLTYPLKDDGWGRQLGWWNSQPYGKIKFMFQTTKQIKHVFLRVCGGEAISERARTSALWTHDWTEIFHRFNANHRLTSQGSLPWHPKDPLFMTLCCWHAYVHMFNITIIGEIGQTAKSCSKSTISGTGKPFGKHTKNYGKSPLFMGKLMISMAIFNSYFDITRG